MIWFAPNAGRRTLIVATPLATGADPSPTLVLANWPLLGTTAKNTVPVGVAGPAVAVSVVVVPYVTGLAEVVRATIDVILLITKVIDFVSITARPSVTLTSKVKVPAAVGVPDKRPLELLRLRPAGRVLPVTTDQLNGDVPPDAVSEELYAVPTTPDAGAEKVNAGPAITVNVAALVATLF